jgi:tRNA dimethylallyltransferase
VEQVRDTAMPVLVITGPTASGKSAVALRIAQRLKGEIISADSRQVYRDISIGTAKPGPDELSALPHHFIDHVDIGEAFTAGQFVREATTIIQELRSRGIQPVVEGGSGLYVRSLVEGIFEGPEVDAELRRSLEQRYAAEGIEALYAELLQLDHKTADFVPKTNIPRVIRALEVCLQSGEKYSEIRVERMKRPPFDSIVFALRWNREQLYKRINSRVLDMISQGLVDEVRNLREKGHNPSMQSLNTVGYKEVFAYLQGDCSEEQMIADIQQHSRNFAKRQMTWFRKMEDIHWLDVDETFDIEQIADNIIDAYRQESKNSTTDNRE